FVTRRIEERDVAAFGGRHFIRADMLCDTARFTGDNVRFANIIEQRCFTVIDMTHDRNDRRARLERLRLVHYIFERIGGELLLEFDRESKFIGDELDRSLLEPTIDGDHEAE